jgi:uncharacterized protein
MMTKIFILLFIFSVPAFAQNQRVVDNAGLLTPEEKTNLSLMTARIGLTYQFDLVIVTEKSIGKSPMDYADDFFDYEGYGFGEERDGCLFLQVTGERDYWFSSSGRAIKILDSYAGDKLEADVVKFLKEGNNYEAYRAFVLDWEEFLALEARGRHYNFFYRWNAALVAAAWLIAFGIGAIFILVWKKGMNTALPQTQAAAYIIPGSLSFMKKEDRFLHRTVSKIRRAQSSGSGGGGSHRSSSGRSHGGRGGKY